jgi:hypothetical protein
MPRRFTALLACPALTLAACGGAGDEPFDAACAQSPQAIERALASAPGRVVLGSGTRLSQCVSAARGGADLQNLGTSLASAADDLAERAVRGDRRAALELGYLIGATRAGARHSAGVQEELARHVELAGARPASRGAAAAAQLARGMRAGAAHG